MSAVETATTVDAVAGDWQPTADELAGGLRTMLLLRRFEEEMQRLFLRGEIHGTVHLYADDGTLMAMASQSTIVRYWDPTARGSVPSSLKDDSS